MAEDGGTLLYMTVGLLLMVGAIVAMADDVILHVRGAHHLLP